MDKNQIQQAFFLVSLTLEDIQKRITVIEEKASTFEQMVRSYVESQPNSVSGSVVSPGDGDGEGE